MILIKKLFVYFDDAFFILYNMNKIIKNFRVIRCVLHLANGNLNDLEYFIKQALIDWRDIIYWDEYDKSDVKIRDFEKPF